MNAEELIIELQKLPPKTQVRCYDSNGDTMDATRLEVWREGQVMLT